MSRELLKIQNVSKNYGRTKAVDNISFSVHEGEIAALLGPNGAGKSTIIKCIAGLLRFEGKIELCSFDNKSVEAKKRLGYVPEIPAAYDLLTVKEHLEFIRRAYKVEDDGYGDELLERFELKDKEGKLGSELSKGMQQKLSIACALLPKPDVIVFDEPFVGLDPHAIKEMKLIFSELKERGKALLISTHMLDTIGEYWDVAHIMKEGRILASKLSSEEAAQEGLEQLFFEITEGGV
ncbi:MAG: ABC transporter ATP-binding protein [Clostridiales bacterium]|nr:ABC transporter ATP-binding protein [Clostridiales bacterium]